MCLYLDICGGHQHALRRRCSAGGSSGLCWMSGRTTRGLWATHCEGPFTCEPQKKGENGDYLLVWSCIYMLVPEQFWNVPPRAIPSIFLTHMGRFGGRALMTRHQNLRECHGGDQHQWNIAVLKMGAGSNIKTSQQAKAITPPLPWNF